MANNPIVLGIDTSGVKCGVALWQNNHVLYEHTMAAPNLHSTLLAEFVSTGLRKINLKPDAVGLVCVTCGPGSFTGLRIGMSYAKGFCFALEKPLIGVTNFEVLAQQVKDKTLPIYTLIDARRESYYMGIFKKDPLVLDEYKIVNSSQLGESITDPGCVVCGEKDDGGECKLPPSIKLKVIQAWIIPGSVCQLGYRKYLAGEQLNLHLLEPLYIQSFAGVP